MNILCKLPAPIVAADTFNYVSVTANHSKNSKTLYLSFYPAEPTDFGSVSCMMLGLSHETFYITLAAMPRKNPKKIDAANQIIRDNANAIATAYALDFDNKDNAHTNCKAIVLRLFNSL